MKLQSVLFTAGILLMSSLPSSAQSAFGIKYTWCDGSPDIQLSGVPKGTTEIEFKLVDLMKPTARHGGATIKYTNQKKVPCGAFTSSYKGPTPPPPRVHEYELTAVAKDKDGKSLGTAKFTRKFPER